MFKVVNERLELMIPSRRLRSDCVVVFLQSSPDLIKLPHLIEDHRRPDVLMLFASCHALRTI